MGTWVSAEMLPAGSGNFPSRSTAFKSNDTIPVNPKVEGPINVS